ncbi:hypothetical protein MMC10_007390 [Thelotrema lepadinum]|nr:hypothetical protein [Thelotrema lepadinum]
MSTESADSLPPLSEKAEVDHLKDFGEFFDYLNRGAKSALPRVSRRHSEAHVLLVRWEEDDLGTVNEINDLDNVFKDLYNYQTEQYLIPSRSSANELEGALVDFKRAHDSDDNLLVLYYGGHGALEASPSNRPGRSIWTAKQKGGPSVVWSDLQGVLERAEADVVFILDCCFASTAARGVARAKEGLWACNSAVTTTGVSDNSFTRNLIEELKSLHAARFNVAMLHARLMRRYRQAGPHKLLTEPWYTYLGSDVVPSVELAPLPKREIEVGGSDLAATDPADSTPSSSLTSSMTSLTIDNQMTETLVLLAVRLKSIEGVPELMAWHRWCHESAPEDVESVHALGLLRTKDLLKIEGHYISHSTLVLASVPIFIWDRIPRSEALSFIGFIKSPNLHIPLEFSMSEDLPDSTAQRKNQIKPEELLKTRRHKSPPRRRFTSYEVAKPYSLLDKRKLEYDKNDRGLEEPSEILTPTAEWDGPAAISMAMRLAGAYVVQALKLLERSDQLTLSVPEMRKKAYPKVRVLSNHQRLHPTPQELENPKGDELQKQLLATFLRLIRDSSRAVGLDLHVPQLLLLAARQGSEDLVRLLLELGADANFKAASDETALSLAGKHGHEALARSLLAQGAEVNLKGHSERTPLLWAAAEGHEEVASLLLANAANVNLRDYLLQTPLSLAAKHGHSGVVTLLLNNGVEVNSKDISKRTPLSLAAESGHEAAASVLLNRRASVNPSDDLGRTPLIWAVVNGKEALSRLLLSRKAQLDHKDKSGRTPLAWAAKQGCIKIVNLLLDHGAELNPRDNDNLTPLVLAMQRLHHEVIEVLLKRGAQVDSVDRVNPTPLLHAIRTNCTSIVRLLLQHHAQADRRDSLDRTPLMEAAISDEGALIELLLSYGATVDAADQYGDTPLLHLMDFFFPATLIEENRIERLAKHKSALMALLNGGANVNARNEKGEVALHLAADNGNTEAIRILLEHGAQSDPQDGIGNTPLFRVVNQLLEKRGDNLRADLRATAILLVKQGGADINTRNLAGETPINSIISRDDTNLAKVLFEAKPDMNPANQPETPLALAIQQNSPVMVSLLLEYGARVDLKDAMGATPLFIANIYGKDPARRIVVEFTEKQKGNAGSL